jgi:hypothetical protein
MGQRGGTAKVTADHEFIRDWVERRGGCPATVKRPGRSAVALNIEYPRRARTPRALAAISWDEFFDRFEQHKLAFQYDEASRGLGSWKLIERASLAPDRKRR